MKVWTKHPLSVSTVFIVLLGSFPGVEGEGQHTYVITGGYNYTGDLTIGEEYFDGVFEKAKDGDYYAKLGFRNNHFI